MALEATPASISTDGNLRVTFLPDTVTNPASVASLNGNDAVPLTYSLTAGGFNHGETQDSVSDERLTLAQVLSRPGRSSETLELQYVWGDADDVAYPALVEGTDGYIVVRYGVPNATSYATGQKVDVLAIKTGKQRRDAPTANGVFTVTQTIYFSAPSRKDVTTVA